MFRKKPQDISQLVCQYLREEGLEVPLNEKRLINSWADIVGPVIDGNCGDKFIRNQTLFVKVNNPALRNDLSMMRARLVQRLNESVGSMVIADVKFY